MPERNRGRNAVPSALDRRKAELAGLPSPPIPDGAAAAVANRVMTYARQEKTKAALPYIDRVRGGLIISGADPGRALETAHPETVEKHQVNEDQYATCLETLQVASL